jgi:hypothetical protein
VRFFDCGSILGVKLNPNKPRVRGYGNDFHKVVLGIYSHWLKPSFCELFAVGIIEFIAVAVAFRYQNGSIELMKFTVWT